MRQFGRDTDRRRAERYFYMSEQEAKGMWGNDFKGHYDMVDGEKAYVAGYVTVPSYCGASK